MFQMTLGGLLPLWHNLSAKPKILLVHPKRHKSQFSLSLALFEAFL